MLTPEQLQSIGETLIPQLDALNTWIASDMIRRFLIRFGRGGDVLVTGTDEWQALVLQQTKWQLEDVQRKISQETGKSKQEIKKIFEDAGGKSVKADANAVGGLPFGLSTGMISIIEDAYNRTNKEIRNLTRTTAGIANQTFIDALDTTYWRVITGAQSYTAAVADAIDRLSEVQAKVRYPSGHTDHLEVAVLRAVRTGTAQASAGCTIQMCKDNGWNYVLVSEHIGARVSAENPIADHAGWQGKIYSINGKTEKYPNLEKSTGYPNDPLGLCGYNCRHSFTPFLPGVSTSPYDGENINAEENRKVYELTQEQRKKERSIRAQKRKTEALKDAAKQCEDLKIRAVIEKKYQKSLEQLSKKNAAYIDYCEKNDLKPYYERLQTA